MQNNIDMNLLMGLLNSNGNPETLINSLANQNPNINSVLKQAQASGLSMKDFTMQYAKQKGINIQPFVDMMSKRGIK